MAAVAAARQPRGAGVAGTIIACLGGGRVATLGGRIGGAIAAWVSRDGSGAARGAAALGAA